MGAEASCIRLDITGEKHGSQAKHRRDIPAGRPVHDPVQQGWPWETRNSDCSRTGDEGVGGNPYPHADTTGEAY